MKCLEAIGSVKDSLQLHDKLNPELWVDYKLKPKVSKQLKIIAQRFFEYLEIPRKAVNTVIVTGSNCNFNYTPFSDIDLHLVVDFKELGISPEEFAEKYFRAAKTVWNDEHNIKIGDYDVEVYVQDIDEKHIASGVYSLTDDDWLRKPERVRVSIDDMAIKAKATEIARQIDQIAASDADDPKPAEDLKAKIRRMRKAGLSKNGEFSVENLVFKVLRNKEYLAKLDKAYKGAIDKGLSLTKKDLAEGKLPAPVKFKKTRLD